MKRPFTKEDTYNYNNCMAYTQSDLDAAVAKAVRERTRRIYIDYCHYQNRFGEHLGSKLKNIYPGCFKEDTP